MTSKSYYSLMSMFALSMMSADGFDRPRKKAIDIDTLPKFKYNFSIPKGAKLYLFESNGNFESFTEFSSRNEMPNYCVFHTIALNDKSAIKKFTKFKNSQNV